MNTDGLLFLILLILLGFAGSFIISSYLDTSSSKFSDYIKESCNNNGTHCDIYTYIQPATLAQPTTIPSLTSTIAKPINTLNQTIHHES